MDINSKSKFWAGDMYHRFESICQDVDKFVGKDTVKFVENQVQSVGMTVKRFYSNVVQDILPLSGDIVKPKSQLVDGEPIDVRDHVSVNGMGTNSTCIGERQLFLNQGSMHTAGDSDASLTIEFDHIMQFLKPPCTDPSPEAETCHLREYDPAIICDGEDSDVEENITRDSIPVIADPSFNNEINSGASDEDHKNSILALSSSPTFSAHEEGLTTIKKEIKDCNKQEGNKSFSVDTESLSDISGTVTLCEIKLPTIEDPPIPSACGANGRALDKDRASHGSYSTKDESFDVSMSVQTPENLFPYFGCNEKEEEMSIIPSTSCTSPKFSSIKESTSADYVKSAENIFHSHSECGGCADNISTPSSTTAADETKDVDALPAFPILESNDNNLFQIDGSEYVTGSSESLYEQHYKDGHSKIVISPSETEKMYEFGEHIGNLDMETVDLSPDVKHDDRNVVSNSNFVHVGSHRRRDFRYYKKLIQDAFTSRKRLSKEYEHLAILYGDIDMESNQHFGPSYVSSFPNTAVHAVNAQSSQEMCETEWELL